MLGRNDEINKIMPAKTFLFTLIAFLTIGLQIMAQNNTLDVHPNGMTGMCAKTPMQADGIVRLSKVEVYPEHLEEYMKYAVEVGEISLRTELGVLTMYALQETENLCRITILETYASQEAYRAHIASAHFQKYKQGTLHMVKVLELLDQKPLNEANRIKNFME